MGGRSQGYSHGNGYSSRDHRADRYASDRTPLPPPPSQAPNFRYYNTAVDEANDAAGLPLASVLVLRNLARQLGKLKPPSQVIEVPDSPTHKRSRDDEHRRSTGAKKPRMSDAAREAARERENEEIEKEEKESENAGWVPRVFTPVKEQLAFVVAHNLTLRTYLVGLLKAISEGGG
jgi:chromatin structure-remodeling complex subunit RSC9